MMMILFYLSKILCLCVCVFVILQCIFDFIRLAVWANMQFSSLLFFNFSIFQNCVLLKKINLWIFFLFLEFFCLHIISDCFSHVWLCRYVKNRFFWIKIRFNSNSSYRRKTGEIHNVKKYYFFLFLLNSGWFH